VGQATQGQRPRGARCKWKSTKTGNQEWNRRSHKQASKKGFRVREIAAMHSGAQTIAKAQNHADKSSKGWQSEEANRKTPCR
jgi:hypothetical protein